MEEKVEVVGSRWNYIKVYGGLVGAGRSFDLTWPWKIPLCFYFGNFPWLALLVASNVETFMGVNESFHLLPIRFRLTPKACTRLPFDFRNLALTSVQLPQLSR